MCDRWWGFRSDGPPTTQIQWLSFLPRSWNLCDLEYPRFGLSPCELPSSWDLSISATYPPYMDGSWSSCHSTTSCVFMLHDPWHQVLIPSTHEIPTCDVPPIHLLTLVAPHYFHSHWGTAFHDFSISVASLQSFKPRNPNMRIHAYIQLPLWLSSMVLPLLSFESFQEYLQYLPCTSLRFKNSRDIANPPRRIPTVCSSLMKSAKRLKCSSVEHVYVHAKLQHLFKHFPTQASCACLGV